MGVVHVERIQERRRAMRVEERGHAYLTETRDLSPIPGMDEFLAPLFGRVLNLSENGILLEMEESICPGRLLKVGFEVDGERIEVEGVVTRVCRPRNSRRVHVGVRFSTLPDAVRGTILRLVEAGRFVPHLN